MDAMDGNLQKMAGWIKAPGVTHYVCALFICCGLHAAAQPSEIRSPAETALGGSVLARDRSAWFALANPAALAPDTTRALLAMFVPASNGIEGYREGAAIFTTADTSGEALAVAASASGTPSYHELGGEGVVSFDMAAGMRCGIALRWHLLAIDGYGADWCAAVDVGMLLRITPELRAAAAVTNITGSTIGGTGTPQRVRFGLAVAMSGATELSIDLAHQLDRGSDLAVGLSNAVADGVDLNVGAGSSPARLAAGVRADLRRTTVEYGAWFISGFGLRHAIGLTVAID